MKSLRIAIAATLSAACCFAGWAGAQDPGAAAADADPAADGADSIAAAAVDSLASPAPTRTDTLWAVRLLKVSTLDSARSLHAAVLADSVSGFARVRARPEGYWYEIFAGPFGGRDEAVGILPRLTGLEWTGQPILFAEPRDDLLLGLVADPPPPPSPVPSAADSIAAAAFAAIDSIRSAAADSTAAPAAIDSTGDRP